MTTKQKDKQDKPDEVIIKPKYDKARIFYGTGSTNIRYWVKTREQKTIFVSDLQSERSMWQESYLEVCVHDASGATPEVLKTLDPTGQRIIWDKDDKRLNIKGAPFHFPLLLGYINVMGNNAQKQYELTPELALNDFLFNVAVPFKDNRQVSIIVGLNGNKPVTKDFYATQCGSIVYEDVDIGTPLSYDLNQYEQKVFRSKGGFLKIPEQDAERETW